MANKKKYIGLAPGTKEYNKAQYICRKHNITFDEYTKNPEKYRMRGNSHPYKVGTKEYARSAFVKHKYGTSMEEVLSMLDKQNNKCAICDESLDNFHIDHCHNTGSIRGILCRTCNIGLGHFKDSKELLNKAADYLVESKSNCTFVS